MLAAEIAATAFDPIGYQMARHRTRAVDALEMLMDSMHDRESGHMQARPMAMYALVRMSIEASAMALWTVQSSKKHDRIYRALQVAYAHLIEYADFASVVGKEEDAAPYIKFRDDKTKRLIGLKNEVGTLKQKELTKPPKLWRILTAVSPTVPPGQPHGVDSPYVIWKMTSAFLHGSDHLTRDLGDLEPRRIAPPCSAHTNATRAPVLSALSDGSESQSPPHAEHVRLPSSLGTQIPTPSGPSRCSYSMSPRISAVP